MPAPSIARRPRRRNAGPARLELAGRLAAVEKHHGPDDPRVSELRRDLAAERLDEAIRDAVTAAPPLTDAQRRRLAAILLGGQAQA